MQYQSDRDSIKNIGLLTSSVLIENLKELVRTERKITAQIVAHIKEVERRRVYIDAGYKNLLTFLLQELGYTRAAAQRRIDGARLCEDVPELHENLKSGELNLSQVSMLAQCVRQKKKEAPHVEINS